MKKCVGSFPQRQLADLPEVFIKDGGKVSTTIR